MEAVLVVMPLGKLKGKMEITVMTLVVEERRKVSTSVTCRLA